MSGVATQLPVRRTDLVIRPVGDGSGYVVKDPRSGEFFELGEEEHFLLVQLDGKRDVVGVRAAFEEKFGDALGEEDLDQFVLMARAHNLLKPASGGRQPPDGASDQGADAPRSPEKKQSILYWRKSLFDPDRFCTWLEPRICFFWTCGFLVFSAGCIVLAALILWTGREAAASSFAHALRWETLLLAWLTMLLVGMLHEFAHGLTCKHHGGEVREIGFLLMFFLPCFYCNVSDAWLFREKSKRLWVTFAGGYFELFLWALAVFAWRLTLPGTWPHYLAFLIVAASGIDTLFNFNPLLKLDGYYLLSDWLEIPNLQQRAGDHLKARLRWLLWGAARPDAEPRGKALLAYGLASFLYATAFLGLSLVALVHFLHPWLGWLGLVLVVLLALFSLRSLFRGLSSGEVRHMFHFRPKRTLIWLSILASLLGLLFVPIEDRARGPFHVRPTVRAELRAPVAGFLREVHGDEGDRVSPGTVIARLDVPDLASRIAQKQAEVREAQAKLRLLEAGPRYEEVFEQRRRVERAQAWRDLAQQDLARAQKALSEELVRLDQQVAQALAELEAAQNAHRRNRSLLARQAVSEAEYQETEKRQEICHARLEQARAEKQARQAKGTLEAEAELARRAKELADAQAALTLLEAGSRPEEIDAERARLARLQEEARYLERLPDKLPVASPVPGLITTPRLKEKVGQYLREGELIGVVEEPASLEAEIALAEQEVARVQTSQAVALKARALPFETFAARVERVAPATSRGEVQGTVTVYCRLEGAPGELRSGMSGHARIHCGQRPLGAILADRLLRYLRTEFWW